MILMTGAGLLNTDAKNNAFGWGEAVYAKFDAE